MADVTQETFATDVVERSRTVPVVIDLWAPWCGPCKQLGPILEKVVGETNGLVELAKVNVDENPQISEAFQVQSIPAVYAMKDGQVVDSFVGAQGEPEVVAFVQKLLDGAEVSAPDDVAEVSAPDDVDVIKTEPIPADEASLREALAAKAGDAELTIALATLLVDDGRLEEASTLLGTILDSPDVRQLMARIRTGGEEVDDIEGQLDGLLAEVKADDDARQRFVDLLELLGPDDPRTNTYRRRLATALF